MTTKQTEDLRQAIGLLAAGNAILDMLQGDLRRSPGDILASLERSAIAEAYEDIDHIIEDLETYAS